MPQCSRCDHNHSESLLVCPRCGQRNIRVTRAVWHRSYHPSWYKATSQNHMNATLPTTTPGQFWSYTDSMVSTIPTLPAQPEQEKLSKVLMAMILFAILLLIVSGMLLLYYTLVTHPAQLRMQATATTQRMETPQAITTHIAQQQAAATAQALATIQAQATATAQAQAIIEARATARALQNIYTSNTAGKPDRSSSLTYETGFHWDIYPTRDNGGCSFHNNAYHSIVNTAHFYAPCLASDTHYGNLAIEVQMTILKGDEGGVIFHARSKARGFYSLRINRAGNYTLTLTRSNGHTLTLVSQSSALIRTRIGQTNTLSVITHGSNIYLYINHHYAGSASDSTYSSGSIGILAINHQHKTDVAFTNLRIWRH